MRKASKLIAAWLLFAGPALAADGAPDPAEVVRDVAPAVVAIQVKTSGTRADTSTSLAVVPGQGSGFFISADGYAVTTAYHLNDQASTVIELTARDGNTFTARVVARDDATNITLVKAEGGPFPFVRLSEAVPRIGDRVVVVGNPPGVGGSMIPGIVSALGRVIGAGPYDDFIQIDAPINRGYSGGLTVDMEGNAIGVTMAVRTPEGDSAGFAMPAAEVNTIVSQLKDHGAVTRGWIGVQIRTRTQETADGLAAREPRGAVVAGASANGPAARAGIEAGDVIIAINGKDVADFHDLVRTISKLAPGAAAQVAVWRNGQQKTLDVTVGRLNYFQ